MGRVDLQVYGLTGDALVVARDARSLVLDLALDIAKVGETPVGDVVELCPLARSRHGLAPVRGVGACGGLGLLVRDVDELQNQRATGDDAAATGQKISTDDVLEDRGLASRLGAHHDLQQKLISTGVWMEGTRKKR